MCDFFARWSGPLEEAMETAVSRAMTERPANPIMRVGELLMASALLPVATDADSKMTELREAIMRVQELLTTMKKSLTDLANSSKGAKTGRTGVLVSLRDAIGPPPLDRRWQDEWSALTAEHLRLDPRRRTLPAERDDEQSAMLEVERLRDSQQAISYVQQKIDLGWDAESADTFTMLSKRKAGIASALRDRRPCYAASTYAICDSLGKQRANPNPNLRRMESMYTHLTGEGGLTTNEPGWANLKVNPNPNPSPARTQTRTYAYAQTRTRPRTQTRTRA